MSDTAAPEVLTEVEDGVLIVTINRPEAKNAMTKAASEAIAAAMDRLDAEDDLLAMVARPEALSGWRRERLGEFCQRVGAVLLAE